MRLKQLRNSLILLLTACIWGVAFVAQSEGMEFVGPFTFTFTRSIIAGFFLIPIIFAFRRFDRKNQTRESKTDLKTLFIGGTCCGLALGVASCLQQIGIQYTTVGKAGFITAFYIIIVPVLGIAFKRKTGPFIWVGVALALAGLYFLCINESFSIGTGDVWVFLCACVFAIHILVIDYFSPKVDGIAMSCIQFFITSLLCLVPMLILERPSFSQITSAWQPILYAGLLSSGVGYTLQIIGQKDLNPTVASLIMSLESVVSVLAGMFLLGQTLSPRETLGCCLMFAAIVLAQLPEPAKNKSDITTTKPQSVDVAQETRESSRERR